MCVEAVSVQCAMNCFEELSAAVFLVCVCVCVRLCEK